MPSVLLLLQVQTYSKQCQFTDVADRLDFRQSARVSLSLSSYNKTPPLQDLAFCVLGRLFDDEMPAELAPLST